MSPHMIAIAVLCLAAATACNRAKSPEAAANDISAARQSAAEEVAEAHRDAAKDVNSAAQDLQAKSRELAESNAKAAYDVEAARADGDHKVSLQLCMTKDGDAQRACKQKADADYDAALANAKASRAAN
jgi:hypothetical protein